jgi:hypothetical protein
MKISTLEKRLARLREKHGDVPVVAIGTPLDRIVTVAHRSKFHDTMGFGTPLKPGNYVIIDLEPEHS